MNTGLSVSPFYEQQAFQIWALIGAGVALAVALTFWLGIKLMPLFRRYADHVAKHDR